MPAAHFTPSGMSSNYAKEWKGLTTQDLHDIVNWCKRNMKWEQDVFGKPFKTTQKAEEVALQLINERTYA